MSIVLAAVFALVCYGVALQGYLSLGEIEDAQQLSDAKGFAFFWAFLGTIGVVFGALGWWIVRTHKEEEA